MPTTTEPTDHTPAELERPAWLDEDQWPFPIREVDTVTYVDVGEGPTLLLVHVGMWSFIWRDLLHELERDFRCVVVEAPGSLLTSSGRRSLTRMRTRNTLSVMPMKVIPGLSLTG